LQKLHYMVDRLRKRAICVDHAIIVLRRVYPELVFGYFHARFELFVTPLGVARAKAAAELLERFRHDENGRRSVALLEESRADDVDLRKNDRVSLYFFIQVGQIRTVVGA